MFNVNAQNYQLSLVLILLDILLYGLYPVYRTPCLGAMMRPEVCDSKESIQQGVQA